MSDYIPFELQIDIIKRLPMKSLVCFRSVSKPWKSLIDSSEFINNYHDTNTQPDHLLVRYHDPEHSERKYVSIDDDDNFPQNKLCLNVPLNVKLLGNASILGSSHGLSCLYGLYRYLDYEKEMAILWNPSIRKSVGIVVPNVLDMPYGNTCIGFGVCPKTSDPKLVKISRINSPVVFNTVEVFTLTSRAWRSISNNLPRKSIVLNEYQVLIDGVIYWTAFDNFTRDDDDNDDVDDADEADADADVDAADEADADFDADADADDNVEYYNLIISFDLTSEEFGEIYPPYRLRHFGILLLSKVYDSVAVLEYYQESQTPVCGVWMMKDGDQKSFTKLFTIMAPNSLILNNILGFRKNCKPVIETIETRDDRQVSASLQVYDPCSKLFNDIGIWGNFGSFSVSSYTETLLLLDHPGSIIYC